MATAGQRRSWAAGLALAAPLLAGAAGWRGDGSGHFADADPPIAWSVDQNVAWKIPMPARGNATPVLFGPLVCVTAEPSTIACYRRKDGAAAWKHDAAWLDTVPASERAAGEAAVAAARALETRYGEARSEIASLRRQLRKKDASAEVKALLARRSEELSRLQDEYDRTAHLRSPSDLPSVGNASSTPVVAGALLVVAFGTGLVEAFTPDGALRWARYLPWQDKLMNGFTVGTSASLLAADGVVVVPLGFVHGLDAATGRTLWTGPAYRDYGTPALATVAGAKAVLLPSGAALRLSDGTRLGAIDQQLTYVGPAVTGRTLVHAGNGLGAGKARVAAYELPAAGAPYEPRKLWEGRIGAERTYASPLIDEGRLFSVNERGLVTILDLETGRTLAEKQLKVAGSVMPSPARAGRYLFFIDSYGMATILDAKPPYDAVGEPFLREEVMASPVFEGRRLYLRTASTLYCFEKKP